MKHIVYPKRECFVQFNKKELRKLFVYYIHKVHLECFLLTSCLDYVKCIKQGNSKTKTVKQNYLMII